MLFVFFVHYLYSLLSYTSYTENIHWLNMVMVTSFFHLFFLNIFFINHIKINFACIIPQRVYFYHMFKFLMLIILLQEIYLWYFIWPAFWSFKLVFFLSQTWNITGLIWLLVSWLFVFFPLQLFFSLSSITLKTRRGRPCW